MADTVEIREADEALLAQAAALHARRYGGTVEARRAEFRRRFSGAAAGRGSFAVVAILSGRVVGTQTYTEWPYEAEGRRFLVVQSGLTFVEEEARGRGVFSRMLAVGEEGLRRRGVDAVVGYPTPMSLPGFVKDGWTELGALRWYVRPIRWWRVLRKRPAEGGTLGDPVCAGHRVGPEPGWDDSFERAASGGDLRMPCGRASFERRYADRRAEFAFFRDDPVEPRVILVGKRRAKHGFRELIVGEAVARVGADPAAVAAAIDGLARDARLSGTVDALSVLLNPRCERLRRLFSRRGFWRTPETVPFVAKGIGAPLAGSPLGDVARWNLLFSDVDTW